MSKNKEKYCVISPNFRIATHAFEDAVFYLKELGYIPGTHFHYDRPTRSISFMKNKSYKFVTAQAMLKGYGFETILYVYPENYWEPYVHSFKENINNLIKSGMFNYTRPWQNTEITKK